MKKRGRKRIEGIDHRTSFLKSVERTLDALEVLGKKRSIGVTELADNMKTAISTAHRVLATLEKKGFAVQDQETGKYALGHMVFQLTRSVIHLMEPVKYVRPYLRELCKKTGENVVFGVITPGGGRSLILAEEVADRAVIARPVLFQRFPIHVCPCGKAYLLTLNDEQIKEVLSEEGMERFTKCSPVSFIALKRQITRFRKLGYALSRDELSVGLSAMASGVCNAEGRFAGAIMVIGPSFRFSDKSIGYWGKLLLRATAKVSLELKTMEII